MSASVGFMEKKIRIKKKWYQSAHLIHTLDFLPKGNKPARSLNQFASCPTG